MGGFLSAICGVSECHLWGFLSAICGFLVPFGGFLVPLGAIGCHCSLVGAIVAWWVPFVSFSGISGPSGVVYQGTLYRHNNTAIYEDLP